MAPSLEDVYAARVKVLEERLRLIMRAALDRIDGDSQPNDTHWSEIVGIADGDPNWLQHARVNYALDHATLVTHCRRLFGYITDAVALNTPDQIAHMMADHLEEAVLPELVLGEDGRAFRHAQKQAG